jgi:hypothetical protein
MKSSEREQWYPAAHQQSRYRPPSDVHGTAPKEIVVLSLYRNGIAGAVGIKRVSCSDWHLLVEGAEAALGANAANAPLGAGSTVAASLFTSIASVGAHPAEQLPAVVSDTTHVA